MLLMLPHTSVGVHTRQCDRVSAYAAAVECSVLTTCFELMSTHLQGFSMLTLRVASNRTLTRPDSARPRGTLATCFTVALVVASLA